MNLEKQYFPFDRWFDLLDDVMTALRPVENKIIVPMKVSHSFHFRRPPTEPDDVGPDEPI